MRSKGAAHASPACRNAQLPQLTGAGFFGGVSGLSFNRAVLRDPVDERAFIDNLHFGFTTAVIPVPGAAVLGALGAGLAVGLRRRRVL